MLIKLGWTLGRFTRRALIWVGGGGGGVETQVGNGAGLLGGHGPWSKL